MLQSVGLDGNTEASGLLGEVGSAKCSTQPAEDLVEWRQGAHLVGQALGPECLEPCFLTKDGAAEIREGSLTKFKFLANGVGQLIEFDARAVAAMTRIAAAARGRTIAVVTHGGVLDCLYRAATGLALDAPRSWQLGNAAINRVLFTGERFTLVGWSDTAHLDGSTLDDASEGDCPTVPRAAE